MHNVELAPAELVLQPMILPRTVRFIQLNLSILPSLLFSPSTNQRKTFMKNDNMAKVKDVLMQKVSCGERLKSHTRRCNEMQHDYLTSIHLVFSRRQWSCYT